MNRWTTSIQRHISRILKHNVDQNGVKDMGRLKQGGDKTDNPERRGIHVGK